MGSLPFVVEPRQWLGRLVGPGAASANPKRRSRLADPQLGRNLAHGQQLRHAKLDSPDTPKPKPHLPFHRVGAIHRVAHPKRLASGLAIAHSFVGLTHCCAFGRHASNLGAAAMKPLGFQPSQPVEGQHPQTGFTLVELVCVLAIMALLSAMAMPVYQRAQNRSQRQLAKLALYKAAQWMEQAATAQGAFPGQLPDSIWRSAEMNYRLQLNSQPLSYQLTATPLGGQTTDPCGALTLNQTGQRGADGSAAANLVTGGSFATTSSVKCDAAPASPNAATNSSWSGPKNVHTGSETGSSPVCSASCAWIANPAARTSTPAALATMSLFI